MHWYANVRCVPAHLSVSPLAWWRDISNSTSVWRVSWSLGGLIGKRTCASCPWVLPEPVVGIRIRPVCPALHVWGLYERMAISFVAPALCFPPNLHPGAALTFVTRSALWLTVSTSSVYLSAVTSALLAHLFSWQNLSMLPTEPLWLLCYIWKHLNCGCDGQRNITYENPEGTSGVLKMC